MVKLGLDSEVYRRVQPLVEQSLNQIIGVGIPKLSTDITDRLVSTKFTIDTSMQFKDAKRQFKREFLQRLLGMFGNVTEVSKIAGIKRESLHRLIKQLEIEPESDLRPYRKIEVVKSVLQDVMDSYRDTLHPSKIEAVNQYLPHLSHDLVDHLPDDLPSMKDAEVDFEREFLSKALAQHRNNISSTARSIGLRFETLHRKLKKIGLR
jgi:DNA-binding NtrC family response regulator